MTIQESSTIRQKWYYKLEKGTKPIDGTRGNFEKSNVLPMAPLKVRTRISASSRTFGCTSNCRNICMFDRQNKILQHWQRYAPNLRSGVLTFPATPMWQRDKPGNVADGRTLLVVTGASSASIGQSALVCTYSIYLNRFILAEFL